MTTKATLFTFFVAWVMVALMAMPAMAASQGAGSGAGGGSGSGDQQQDQDRIQDPTTHTGDDTPDQDQLRTKDQIHLYQATDSSTPTQDQLRTQDQDRIQDPTLHAGDEPIQDQLRTQDRDRINFDTASSLEQYVQEQERARVNAQDGSATATPAVQARTRAQIATEAVVAAQNMLGQNGAQLGQVATQVQQAFTTMTQQEEQLQTRSWIGRLFFGQNQDTVQTMQQEMEQNQQRLEELKQTMQTCTDCDQNAVNVLVEQFQALEQEQNRLQQVVDGASGHYGLFGWLFGN